jgi:hypothetical protein
VEKGEAVTARYLIVDGMLSGTGVRDAVAGGHLAPAELGLSEPLANAISQWVARYENAHYFQFADEAENQRLDHQGMKIALEIARGLPNAKVEYYSNAYLKRLPLE